jgi:hypothetical protein
MRTPAWTLLACCSSLLTACAEVPPGDPSAGPELGTGQAALTTLVTRTFSSGQVADLGWDDELSGGYYFAASDNTNRVATAFVSGTNVLSDPTSQVCATDPVLGSYCHYTRVTYDALYAEIDPADLTVGANSARLQTDLSKASVLSFTRCHYDSVALTTVCTDVLPSPTISLEWRKTSTEYDKDMGIGEYKSGPQIFRIAGGRLSYSAEASGNIQGLLLQRKDASMGTSSTLSVTVMRTP